MAFNFSFPSLRSLISSLGAGSLLAQIPITSYTSTASAPSCPVDGPLSCKSNVSEASCCFVYPGGQLLQTQFWDASPAVGPIDSWTLHGLWPDLCDGTYDQFCTSAPQYKNITQILTAAGETSLLSYMSTYWLPNSGSLESFWEHEWNKHGTCINTLSPSCYGPTYTPGTAPEVVDFFTRAVSLFKTLDTYSALAEAGITPSVDNTYTSAEIQDALRKVTGQDVVLGCYQGQLNQAWYYYNVRGNVQSGTFVPTAPSGSGKGSCPASGIKYLPKKTV